MDRMIITKQHEQIRFEDYKSIEQLIFALQEIQKDYGETAFIDSDYDWDDCLRYYVFTRVEEDDDAYNRRIQLEKDQKTYRKNLYDQLKKEFENE